MGCGQQPARSSPSTSSAASGAIGSAARALQFAQRMSQAPPSTFGGFDNLKDDLRSRLGKKVEL